LNTSHVATNAPDPMSPQSYRFCHRLRVRWAEVDMQKIVFNPHYLMYVDTAVADYWRHLALPYEQTMHSLAGDLYLKKATVEYHASARYDECLDVYMRCARVGNSSALFQGLVTRDGLALASTELVYVFADPQTQKSKPIPQALKDALLDYERGDRVVSFESTPGATQLVNRLGLPVARLNHKDGQLHTFEVHPALRRNGWATALARQTREAVGPLCSPDKLPSPLRHLLA
jgi:YbgC/YbaW family acyl-CoA thioester hydrolase